MNLIHEGKSKRVYEDPESDERVIIEFSNTVTAGDGKKKEEFAGKGQLACDMSYLLLGFLEGKGIDTHLIRSLRGPKLLCHKASIIPIEVVCRNYTAGSFCRRYGIEKGRRISPPLTELFYKDDSLSDPLITAEAAVALDYVDSQDLGLMISVADSVNYYLSGLLRQVGLELVDFKLEFGKTSDGHIVVADEISADTMRIWDASAESLDKDVFREEKGNLVEAYSKLYNMISKAKGEMVPTREEVVEVVVEPKRGIKNPPGEVTRKALMRLGFAEASSVRVGKLFKITLKGPMTSEVLKQLNIMSIKLLSNPISESHETRV